MASIEALASERRAPLTDPTGLGFATTEELADLEAMIGQDRAVEAVRFGMGIRRDGYNLFALGPPGIGKHTMIRQFLESRARAESTPADQCYVHNFADPGKPNAIGPVGRPGAALGRRHGPDRLSAANRAVGPRLRRGYQLGHSPETVVRCIRRRPATTLPRLCTVQRLSQTSTSPFCQLCSHRNSGFKT
jgi:hypothetical protein